MSPPYANPTGTLQTSISPERIEQIRAVLHTLMNRTIPDAELCLHDSASDNPPVWTLGSEAWDSVYGGLTALAAPRATSFLHFLDTVSNAAQRSTPKTGLNILPAHTGFISTVLKDMRRTGGSEHEAFTSGFKERKDNMRARLKRHHKTEWRSLSEDEKTVAVLQALTIDELNKMYGWIGFRHKY